MTQFRLVIKHIPGVKNEFCDWLSRAQFDSKVGQNFDQIAQEAFDKMDTAIDFAILFKISDMVDFDSLDYNKNEWSEIWTQLDPYHSKVIEDKMFYRTPKELFCETKKVVPKEKIQKVLSWCHEVNGHPGPEKTILFFAQKFHSELGKKALLDLVKPLCENCEVCLKSKPNTQKDRGLVGALPIPPLANDIVFVDFIQMDDCDNYNYVLTIVDGLTKFVKFVPCTKNISGEDTLKLILRDWVQHYENPSTIMSDNDVRFSQTKGFYQKVFRSLGIDIKFFLAKAPTVQWTVRKDK